MKRKSLEHTQTTTTTTTVQAHEDYDGGLTELQKSIIREQQQQQQHEVPPWYVEEEQMFLQQEDAYFEIPTTTREFKTKAGGYHMRRQRSQLENFNSIVFESVLSGSESHPVQRWVGSDRSV